MYLGRESMNSKNVPVYAMPQMLKMLQTNVPWSQLVELRNIELRPLADNVEVKLHRVSATPFLVPHRDEFSETVGYRIRSSTRSLVFIPDIDKWEKWAASLESVVRSSDYVLIDGTFFANGEINRPMNEVPHPFVTETMELLKGLPLRERRKVVFIHFNHSNPLIQENRKKLTEIANRGFRIARTGMRFEL